MEDIVIVAAARTAVGKFGGSLAKVPATELGSIVIKSLLERSGLPVDAVGEVILGQVLAAGVGQNPARQAGIKSGLAKETPALTINAVCGSGLKAVMLAAQAVAWGDSEIVIAGGQENMSASPHVLLGSRDGQRMGDWKMIDSMIVDGLWDVYNQYHMGITAENVAKEHGISRDAQDALALGSQQKASAAQDAGKFKDEIVGVSIPQRKGDPVLFNSDEFINAKTTAEVLAGLRPAFDKAGSVTAGNASGINDGAAFFVLGDAETAAKAGYKAMARLVSYAVAGVPNDVMGEGPIRRTGRLLVRAVAIFFVVSIAMTAVYRVVPPPVTLTMLLDPNGFEKDWTSLSRIDRDMVAAVIAGEDAKFCEHNGFDTEAIEEAMERNARGGSSRARSSPTRRNACTRPTLNLPSMPKNSWVSFIARQAVRRPSTSISASGRSGA